MEDDEEEEPEVQDEHPSDTEVDMKQEPDDGEENREDNGKETQRRSKDGSSDSSDAEEEIVVPRPNAGEKSDSSMSSGSSSN